LQREWVGNEKQRKGWMFPKAAHKRQGTSNGINILAKGITAPKHSASLNHLHPGRSRLGTGGRPRLALLDSGNGSQTDSSTSLTSVWWLWGRAPTGKW